MRMSFIAMYVKGAGKEIDIVPVMGDNVSRDFQGHSLSNLLLIRESDPPVSTGGVLLSDHG